VVTNMYPHAGNPYAGIFVERQVTDLQALGADIEVVSIAGARGRWDYVGARARVRGAIARFRPELIHCHYGYTPLAVVGMGVPYVVTLCGDDLNGASDGHGGKTLKSRAGVLVTQGLAGWSRRVIVRSQAMQAKLWPAARRRSDVIANGVDTSLFSPGSRDEARRRRRVAAADLVLGFVHSGRQRTKRIDLAKATCHALNVGGVHAELLIADGEPPTEMPWFYRACDCLLMTSDSEGAPNCVREALACGIPVVSVPVGDLPELISRPAMGAIADRDPGALADAVRRLPRAPDTPASLLPAAMEARMVAHRVIDLYRQVRGAQGSPVVVPDATGR
jgi:glycosyltransferase involved in cell wall biosynthesis